MILLIRHAAAHGGAGRYIGSTDLDLSSAGEAEATALAQALRFAPLAAIYTSPLRRARRTAQPLADQLQLTAIPLDTLREIHLGLWEGQFKEDIRQSSPKDFTDRGNDFAGFHPPEGESFEDLAVRAESALQIMASGPLPCAAVTHAGVIRVVLCRALGLSVNELFRFHPVHTGCTLLAVKASPLSSATQTVPSLIAENLAATAAAIVLQRSI